MLANLPGSGIAFYLWVGMFGVFIVAQFWAFAADLYADERGGRLLPLIGIGATAGAAAGSFLTELAGEIGAGSTAARCCSLATIPLGASILLTRIADVRGPLGTPRNERVRPTHAGRAQGRRTGHGALAFVLRHRYLLAAALVALFTNWVNTNGENLLFRVVQEALEQERRLAGITDPAATISFVRDGTAAFYGNFYFWVNVSRAAAAGAGRFPPARLRRLRRDLHAAADDRAALLLDDGVPPDPRGGPHHEGRGKQRRLLDQQHRPPGALATDDRRDEVQSEAGGGLVVRATRETASRPSPCCWACRCSSSRPAASSSSTSRSSWVGSSPRS